METSTPNIASRVINDSGVPGNTVADALNQLQDGIDSVTLQNAYDHDPGAFPQITCSFGTPFGLVGSFDVKSEDVSVVPFIVRPHDDHTTADADIVQITAPGTSSPWISVTPYGGIKIVSPFNSDHDVNPWVNSRFIIDAPANDSSAFIMWVGVSFGTSNTLLSLDGKGNLTVPSLSAGGANLTGDLAFSDGKNIIFSTTVGSKIGNSALQKIGIWNATPIVQPANTVAVDSVLANIGLRASGGLANFATTLKPRAGTATAGTAPVVFTSGTNLTTPVAGTLEYNGELFFSPSTTRFQFAFIDRAQSWTAIQTYNTNTELNFRATNQKVYSSAASTLDLDTQTTLNFRVGTTIKTALTATALSLTGDFKLTTAGNGIYLKEGTNATAGRATLTAGSVVVNTTKVTAASEILLTSNVDGGTPGTGVRVSARVVGTSFTITSLNALDTSQVSWVIFEPA